MTFLQGLIEEIPLPDASVDVVISNCVINLSTDKPSVLREIGRVLQAGRADRHQRRRRRRPARAGASARSAEATSAASRARSRPLSTRTGLRAAGFDDISVEFTHEVADGMHGAIVKAVKA